MAVISTYCTVTAATVDLLPDINCEREICFAHSLLYNIDILRFHPWEKFKRKYQCTRTLGPA